jgi:hypothetical protein
MRQKAVDFLSRIGEDERAADFASMSIEEYAANKKIQLLNPKEVRPMARTTRSELEEENERLLDALEEARTAIDEVLSDYEDDEPEE